MAFVSWCKQLFVSRCPYLRNQRACHVVDIPLIFDRFTFITLHGSTVCRASDTRVQRLVDLKQAVGEPLAEGVGDEVDRTAAGDQVMVGDTANSDHSHATVFELSKLPQNSNSNKF